MKKLVDINQLAKLENSEKAVDFEILLMQFKNEEELKCLKIGEILYTDFAEINELKAKTKKFIEACQILLDEKYTTVKETSPDEEILEKEVLDFFSDKFNELCMNETNLHVFIDNLEKIQEIVYTATGVKATIKKDI